MNTNIISKRGRTFVGTIKSYKAQKTATVEWEREEFVSKYERYTRKLTKVKAHVPDDMKNLKEGMKVKIEECRPISKTKKFVITEIVE